MNKILLFTLILGVITYSVHSTSFEYLHDPSSTDCQSKYDYFYNNNHGHGVVQYGVSLLVRADKDHPNALLFGFENYENATRKLSNYPIRAYFDDNGKITRYDADPNDPEESVTTKKPIVATTQLDWTQVKNALTTPSEFKSEIDGLTSKCNIAYNVNKIDSGFGVLASRNALECTGPMQSEYEKYDKYKESTKVWKFTFDQSQKTNFVALTVDVVDYFGPGKTVVIDSGFTFRGCDTFTDQWDVTGIITQSYGSSFEYLHDSSKDCQSKYEYFYLNKYENGTTRAEYGVTMLVRGDKENSNALLFHFKNYENATKILAEFPVRVYFDESGKMVKFEINPNDPDESVSTKKAIIFTTQLDWGHVTSALKKNGPSEFKSLIKGKTKECNIAYSVKVATPELFNVLAERNFTECTSSCNKTHDYPKYNESTKTWRYTFHTSQTTNFIGLRIDIVDYFAPEKVVTIQSDFFFSECEKFTDDWNTTGLEEDTRDYSHLYEKRGKHDNSNKKDN
uniref:CSON007156 protein n=1 Tax=Culicoides sonorensis TaxID=179676 RepID=A0A336MTQ6_CULSO